MIKWVLAGAGNAHLRALRLAAMRRPDWQIMLVNRSSRVLYSAMVPRYVAGDLPLSEIEIDLPTFCAAHGFEFRLAEIDGLDREKRQLTLTDRAPLSFDMLSLSLGSSVKIPGELRMYPGVLPLKPLETFASRLESQLADRGPEVIIVGGGASGCEIAIALAKRLKGQGRVIRLLQADPELVPGFPKRARQRIRTVLRDAGISFSTGAEVVGGDERRLRLRDGSSVDYGVCLIATEGHATELISRLSLPRDGRGFLEVDATLRVSGAERVFAAGDCVSIKEYPGLPRNGVYAVRQGEALWRGVQAVAAGRTPSPWKPHPRVLNLFNLGDGSAALVYGSWTTAGRGCRVLKDRIDRQWLDGFRRPAMNGVMAMEEMTCGGCGAKVASSVLRRALDDLPILPNENVIAGCHSAEDVAIHQPPVGKVEVQTVDFFPAFVDDPKLFGELTAIHALNDVFAANAQPFSALALCSVPTRLPTEQGRLLEAMLRGAITVLEEHRTTLTGGHTTAGESLGLGFTITGYAMPDQLFRKHALRAGDELVLTKALGTGALLAALMRERGRADWLRTLLREMRRSNAAAAALFAENGVRGCTDITGFGLWGHVQEMLAGGGLVAEIDLATVPVLDGFREVTQAGIASTLFPANLADAGSAKLALPAFLFDPQTCGGLLAGVPSGLGAAVVGQLRQNGYPYAARIGTVTNESTSHGPGRVRIHPRK